MLPLVGIVHIHLHSSIVTDHIKWGIARLPATQTGMLCKEMQCLSKCWLTGRHTSAQDQLQQLHLDLKQSLCFANVLLPPAFKFWMKAFEQRWCIRRHRGHFYCNRLRGFTLAGIKPKHSQQQQ